MVVLTVVDWLVLVLLALVTCDVVAPVDPLKCSSTSLGAPGWYQAAGPDSSLPLLQCFKPDHTKANTCICHSANTKVTTPIREAAEMSTCFTVDLNKEKLFRLERNSLDSGYWRSPIILLSKDTKMPSIPSECLCTFWCITFMSWGLKLLKIL